MITTLILAGGMGSRLGDLTKVVPKPLVDIWQAYFFTFNRLFTEI